MMMRYCLYEGVLQKGDSDKPVSKICCKESRSRTLVLICLSFLLYFFSLSFFLFTIIVGTHV